ncbi:MAG TPA: Uma2 family endonuclease, partial [Pyrinomonadaceae bacterium]|nr:Uma2 family endonuclease [Pyrinomonadaceae bacterium]
PSHKYSLPFPSRRFAEDFSTRRTIPGIYETASNIVAGLRQQMKGRPCEVYPNDMRVKVSATGLYTYPDAIVVCGEPRFEDAHVDTLLNPTLIVEVLSESTAAYDRGQKFAHYRGIESLTEYVLVAQDECRVEHFAKQSDRQWLQTVVQSPEAEIELVSIQGALRLREIYDRVF